MMTKSSNLTGTWVMAMTWQMVMIGAEALVVRVAEGQVAVAQEAKEAEVLVVRAVKVEEDQVDVALVVVALVVVDLEDRAEEALEVKVEEAQEAKVDVVLAEEVQAVKEAEVQVVKEVEAQEVKVVRVALADQAFGLECLIKAAKIWTSSAAIEVLAAEHRPAKVANGASSARMNASS